jgi:hypothetical protein
MIKSFTFACNECKATVTISIERFEEFTVRPLICSCGHVPPVPSQKLFWVALKLRDAWLSLPEDGVIPHAAAKITIDRQPAVTSLFFRLKMRTDTVYRLSPSYLSDNPALIFPCVFEGSPDNWPEPLLEFSRDNWQAWLGLEPVGAWMIRLNQEIRELCSHNLYKFCPMPFLPFTEKRETNG